MKGSRYIALIAVNRDARLAWERATAATFRTHPSFELQTVGDRLALVAQGGAAIAIGKEGFVVGHFYERSRCRPIADLDRETSRLIVTSSGTRLIRAYWGSYVAFIAAQDRDCVEVVRAPLGDLGCYSLRSTFGLFVASDVELLRDFAEFEPRIEWTSLVRHVAASDLSTRRTCLEGLHEVSGGERLSDQAGRQTIDQAWPVWDFVSSSERKHDAIEAARRVGDAIETAVTARAGAHETIVLRLSGGLDSSIVAASLASANRSFVALTMVTHDSAGDERMHARAVAEHLGIELIEAIRETGSVDLQMSDAAGLPNPTARGFAQATMRVACKAARDHGATAIFDGGGGDNLFASLQSPAPVADCLDGDGGAGHFWRTARSIGIAGATGTLETARRALVRKLTRGPSYRWPVEFNLLSRDARAMADGALDHPWLATPRGALPGCAAHIALLAGAQSVVQSVDARATLASISPLIAQPVAEACLRVPSWLWTRDGHNRVIARDAFASHLPPAIAYRRDKGAPDSFLIELIEANFDMVRAMLTEGILARQGLLDIGAIVTALEPARLAKGYGYVRLMQLVDAEAWAQSWFRDDIRAA